MGKISLREMKDFSGGLKVYLIQKRPAPLKSKMNRKGI